MKKKIFAVLSAALLLIGMFSGCSDGKNIYKYYGDALSRDTLRICVDSLRTDPSFTNIYQSKDPDKENREYFNALIEELKAVCGVEKIQFEMVPQEEASRKTKLQRLRTEIMAGSGPDVFIVQTTWGWSPDEFINHYEEAIFSYPEKSMDVGLFLPLDEYMEKNTRFTDWDAQTQAVLRAGRSDEGQVVIPMTYYIPFFVYPKAEVNIPYTKELTRREILDDPETAKLGAALYTAIGRTYNESTEVFPDAIRDSFGKYADYQNEELLFTEDELYAIANEAFKLREVMDANEWPPNYSEYMGDMGSLLWELRTSTEMQFVPRYNIDGGITARVTNFMAINRNTKFPEEAYSVIDYLMQEDMQRNSRLYNIYFSDGFPLQNDIGSEEKPLNEETSGMFTYGEYLSAQHMEELLAMKEQISAVNIDSELDYIFREMWEELSMAMRTADGYADIPREPVTKAYEKMARAMKE